MLESPVTFWRVFTFPDFRTALEFVNRVGEPAEEQEHHPDLLLSWGRVEVRIWTHEVDGPTESDFILAAKIDRLPRPAPAGWPRRASFQGNNFAPTCLLLPAAR